MTEDRTRWFEEEIERLLPELYGTALRLARHQADAQDLVADAVAQSWAHLDSLRDRSSFRGWIFRILTNAFITRYRAERVKGIEESLDEQGDGEAEFSLFERLHQPVLLWWGNPEREFLNRLLREDLERAMDALPDAFRLVVVLADLQGFTYQEIAVALDVPIGTVRSRLARGRALLQKALWAHAVDAGLAPERVEGTKKHL